MKYLSNPVLVLLAGALLPILQIQDVAGKSTDTNIKEDVLKDVEGDPKMMHKRNRLQDFHRTKRAISAAAVTAASSVILAGTTLAGTTMTELMATGHSVVVGMEIDNYSKWLLYAPLTYPHGGYISTPAGHVQPGQREAMVGHKTSYTATGTYGTVSWQVNNGSGKRIIVMWSVPFNHNFYSNWLAVGIIPAGDDGSQWFDQMYYRSGPFVRGEYYHGATSIQYCDTDMCVNGIMGTSYKPPVKISFYPKRKADLAPGVQGLV